MPWPRDPEATWSLTRRLSVIFAATSCTILFVFTVFIAQNVVDTLREETRNFLHHELLELSHGIQEGDGSDDAVRKAVREIASVTEEPECAFRVRRPDGTIVAEAGSKRLRALAPDPIDPRASWRERLLRDEIAIGAVRLDEPPITLELVVDASAKVDVITEFIWTALGMFLVAAAASALAGWWTAHRGLKGLRDVIVTARSVDSPASLTTISLDGVPREVRSVGEALNVMLDRIRRESEAMRTFTAGLAHELRSPLQNLIGETEVTLLSERPATEYRDVLHSHLDDLHELSDAVDNLVTYCRTADPGVRSRQAERFDLADEARLRLERERRTAERVGVEIEFERSGNTELAADRESCLRVVRNLVANAITWSPRGGVVRVAVEGTADDVRLIVEDDGPGVAPELVERVFEPFVSGRSREGRRGGYGLGLTICRTVMDDHGGSIRHEARTDGGARFVATFPRAAPVTSALISDSAGT